MLVRALTLAAITGAAVASTLRKNNQTEIPSVDLGYEIHTATTNVRRMARATKRTRITADVSDSHLERIMYSPTSHMRSSLRTTYGSTRLASLKGPTRSSTTAQQM